MARCCTRSESATMPNMPVTSPRPAACMGVVDGTPADELPRARVLFLNSNRRTLRKQLTCSAFTTSHGFRLPVSGSRLQALKWLCLLSRSPSGSLGSLALGSQSWLAGSLMPWLPLFRTVHRRPLTGRRSGILLTSAVPAARERRASATHARTLRSRTARCAHLSSAPLGHLDNGGQVSGLWCALRSSAVAARVCAAGLHSTPSLAQRIGRCLGRSRKVISGSPNRRASARRRTQPQGATPTATAIPCLLGRWRS
jgi:hypothetical protein